MQEGPDQTGLLFPYKEKVGVHASVRFDVQLIGGQ